MVASLLVAEKVTLLLIFSGGISSVKILYFVFSVCGVNLCGSITLLLSRITAPPLFLILISSPPLTFFQVALSTSTKF